jgi:hypothetical protein
MDECSLFMCGTIHSYDDECNGGVDSFKLSHINGTNQSVSILKEIVFPGGNLRRPTFISNSLNKYSEKV